MFRFDKALSLLLCVSSLLQWTSAQFTGLVTSPGNKYIVTIEITNPTTSAISVLAWNNVFDNTTALPIFFDVKDDMGNVVPLASMNVMRAGFSSNDLYTLTPGSTYYRTVDLRQCLQNLPSGPSAPLGGGFTPKVFTIAPPPSFKGFIGDPSTVIASPANFNSNPKTLGDLSQSNLQDITVSSTPTRFSAVFPLIGYVDSSFESPADGAHVDGNCTGQDLTDMSNALFDTGVYANSLAIAANHTTNTLFPLFFSVFARQSVSFIATAAANSVQGQGPHVDLFCDDIESICADPNVLGYSFTPSFLGNAYIVLCPTARTLGRAPAPCQTGASGSATASHVMFHLMMTLNNVIPAVMTNSIDGPAACQQLPNLTLIDPTTNPDSLAQLALAEWADGLGGPPYNGASCLPTRDIHPEKERRAVQPRRLAASTSRKRTSRVAKRDFPPNVLRYTDVAYDMAVTQECSAAEASMLQYAVANAQALAKYASSDIESTSSASAERWTTFFNGDATVKAQVKKFYDAVSTWNTTAPYVNNVQFRCDAIRRSPFCRSGGLIQVEQFLYPEGKFAMLVVCPSYFYNPMASECINPMSMAGGFKELAQDQGGIMLTELLHIVTQQNQGSLVEDGNPECYNWNCMVQNAHDRVLPTFPDVNLPERVAINYEFFAYANRASRTDCTWTEFAGATWGAFAF